MTGRTSGSPEIVVVSVGGVGRAAYRQSPSQASGRAAASAPPVPYFPIGFAPALGGGSSERSGGEPPLRRPDGSRTGRTDMGNVAEILKTKGSNVLSIGP